MAEMGHQRRFDVGGRSAITPIATELLCGKTDVMVGEQHPDSRAAQRSVRPCAQRSDEDVASELVGSHTASTTIGLRAAYYMDMDKIHGVEEKSRDQAASLEQRS